MSDAVAHAKLLAAFHNRYGLSRIRIVDFLDEITSLHYVKIDVEGGEIACPRGGVNTLRR